MRLRRVNARRVRHVRFTDAEWAMIEAAAEAVETFPSTYVRETSVGVARKELVERGDGGAS